MAEFTGKDLNVQWIYSGGTVDLSGDYRRLEVSEPIDTVDASAGSDTHRRVMTTLTNGRARLLVLMQTGGTVLHAAVKPGNEGTLIWGEEGTVAGKPKHTVEAVCIDRSPTYAYDDVSQMSVEWNLQAAPTDSTY